MIYKITKVYIYTIYISFFLLCEVEYLNILNGLLSYYGNNSPTITVLRYDIEMNNNYKSVLRRVKKLGDNHIVVTGSSDTMPEFLKQVCKINVIYNSTLRVREDSSLKPSSNGASAFRNEDI